MAEEKIVFNPDVERQGMRRKKEPKKPADKPKAEEKTKPEKEHFINKYGFLHISDKLTEHLGVPKFGKDTGKKVVVTIELIEGGFIVRKA